jgi:hypothetical protein
MIWTSHLKSLRLVHVELVLKKAQVLLSSIGESLYTGQQTYVWL